jgi:hypothetical protein
MLGSGIDGVRLGMTAAAAHRILRPTGTGFLVQRIEVRPDVRYFAYEYRRDCCAPSHGLAVQGRRGRMRVVAISTWERGNRTLEGIHAGMSLARLQAVYGRTIRCQPASAGNFPFTLCIVGTPSLRSTLFRIDRNFHSENPTITWIAVRERGIGILPP